MADVFEELLELEKIFATGKHPRTLLTAISICLKHDLIVPDWAKLEFEQILFRAFTGQLKSWDEAFGRPSTKAGWRRLRKHAKAFLQVDQMVAKAHARGEPIDDTLFSKIGRELGVGGKTTVKMAYRHKKQALQRQKTR